MEREKSNSGTVVISSFIIVAIIIVGGFYWQQKNQVSRSDQLTGITTVKEDDNSVNPITYQKFTADDTGLSFNVPTGVEVYDNLNGFSNSWKFIYNNDSFEVFYSGFKDDKVNYDSWAEKTNVTITEKANSTIYIEDGLAKTEAFFLNHDPIVTITVIKQEGTALVGETSSSDDKIYQHLTRVSLKIPQPSLFFEERLCFL